MKRLQPVFGTMKKSQSEDEASMGGQSQTNHREMELCPDQTVPEAYYPLNFTVL